MNNEKFMEIALAEARKAYKNDDIPVGAIIVKDNKIISRGYNKKEKTKIATKHAEIIAIEKACQKLGTWHLEECILYTTMEPCIMCFGAILQSRIKKVVFSIKNEKFGGMNKINIKNIEIIQNIKSKESLQLVQQFFQQKRY